MPKARDFTNRIIPLFVIVMIGWVLVISLLCADARLELRTRVAALWLTPRYRRSGSAAPMPIVPRR